MQDVIFIGLALAFFGLTAWLATFADRIMPVSARERSEEGREEAA